MFWILYKKYPDFPGECITNGTIQVVNAHFIIITLLFILGIGSTSGMWWWQEKEKDALRTSYEHQIQTLNETNASTTRILTNEKETLAKKVEKLSETIFELTGDRDGLQDSLEKEQEKVGAIEKQVGKALKTVGVLDKLSKTDEELLQKYSKVYFLNEHYIPSKLSSIKKAYVYDESRDHKLHSQVMPFFENMVEDALKSDVKLYASSAYRSFDEQASLKSAYAVTYGSGANTFSADQGYSEHQLGTTIDFVTTGIQGNIDGFENTPAFTWMVENAHKYGFVMSYPKGNAYYVYEPWHWRFVGEDLARELKKESAYFYDLDQRDINEYLISIFD